MQTSALIPRSYGARITVLTKLKRLLEDAHLIHWLILGGIALIGYLEGIPKFWILAALPIAAASGILVQKTWFEWVGWWTLPEASRRAYQALEGTEWVDVATAGTTPEQRLNRMAEKLSREAAIWGTREPGTPVEISGLIKGIGHMAGGGAALHMEGNDRPSYTSLKIRRAELRRALRHMKLAAAANRNPLRIVP